MIRIFSVWFAAAIFAVVALFVPAGGAWAAEDDSAPATKGDIRRVEGDIRDIESQLNIRGQEMSELRAATAGLGAAIAAQGREISGLRADIREMRSSMLMVFVMIVGVFTAAIIALTGLVCVIGFGNWDASAAEIFIFPAILAAFSIGVGIFVIV